MRTCARTHHVRAHAHAHVHHPRPTLSQVSLVGVLWFGCNLVIDGHLDIGELTSFLLLAIYTIASLGGLLNLFSAIMSALGISRRIFELLDTTPKLRLTGGRSPLELRGRIIHTYVHACMHVRTYIRTYMHMYIHACVRTSIHTCVHTCIQGGRSLLELRGRIMMEDVHFTYPSRPAVPVLNGVSLEVACTCTCTCRACHVHVHVHVHMHVHTCTCTHAYSRTCTHDSPMQACAHVCMHP